MRNFVNLAEIDQAVQRKQANDFTLKNALYQQQKQEQADRDAMAVRDIYSQSGGDLNTAKNKLYQAGYFDQAGNIEKQMLERRKTESEIGSKEFEIASKRLDLIGQGMGFVRDNPTRENAITVFDRLRAVGAIDENQYNDFTAQIPDDPALIANGATAIFQGALDAKDQLSKFETRDAGGQVVTQAINPVTQRVETIGSIDKTQSPDNIANNERMMAEGAANRAVTIRGQNLTDARVRSGAEGGLAQKPLPTTALKLQTEALEKLAVASNINTDLAAIESQIESGKLRFGPISNLQNTVANMAGMSTEQSRNFATFKSTLEKLRNDSLRLNTGVQTDGDAQRAWNELFQNINDTEFVKQRLGEIRKINERGADLQKLQVDNIRANYNAPQIDYTQYETQAPALNNGKQQIIPQGAAAGTINQPSVSNW